MRMKNALLTWLRYSINGLGLGQLYLANVGGCGVVALDGNYSQFVKRRNTKNTNQTVHRLNNHISAKTMYRKEKCNLQT